MLGQLLGQLAWSSLEQLRLRDLRHSATTSGAFTHAHSPRSWSWSRSRPKLVTDEQIVYILTLPVSHPNDPLLAFHLLLHTLYRVDNPRRTRQGTGIPRPFGEEWGRGKMAAELQNKLSLVFLLLLLRC